MKLNTKLRAAVDEIVEHYNDHHPDAVQFVARSVFPDQSFDQAQIIDVEQRAMIFEVASQDHGKSQLRLELELPIEARDDMATRFLGTLYECRKKSPEAELTSLEREMERTRSLPTTPLTVKSSVPLTPCIREIVFSGDFSQMNYPGWDAFLFFFVPKPGEQLPDDFSMAQWRSMEGPDKPGGAYYTIRELSDDEMICWFVVHEVYGAVSDWASRSAPGDRVAAWGPRVAFAPKGEETHYYLFADETALAAAAAIMDQLPITATVTLIAEVDNADSEIDLRCEAHWQVHWLHRQGVEPGHYQGTHEFFESMSVPRGDDLYVYAAMETRQTQKLKKSLKQKWGLTGAQIRCVGYWRANHHA